MFISENHKLKHSPTKIWLSSPTMHGPELTYMTEAFETNWMSTVSWRNTLWSAGNWKRRIIRSESFLQRYDF